MEIVSLTGLGHLAPRLAGWHYGAWSHLYPAGAWSEADAAQELRAMADPQSRDRTWVAFSGPARDEGSLLGSVSLLTSDGLAGFEHLTPWLASMFVKPEARRRGVAAALTEALLRGAREAGHGQVFLFTAGQESYWQPRGWDPLATAAAGGHRATVMVRATGLAVERGPDADRPTPR